MRLPAAAADVVGFHEQGRPGLRAANGLSGWAGCGRRGDRAGARNGKLGEATLCAELTVVQSGRAVAVSISAEKGVAKANVQSALAVEGHGLEGDAHAGAWHRQVSLLALESIAKMIDKGAEVGPGSFAENITTEGVDFSQVQVGDQVRVGEAVLEVTQLGKECHDRCAIFQQVGDCVMPREGVFARVLRGARIRVGDRVEIARRTADITTA